jgi:RNA polymerase sigma-19 factor, ECF subfamily
MEDAEDIVQETFYKIWKNKNELDENKSIQSYLFTSVRNSCLNILLHKKTENQYARLMACVYLDNRNEINPHESLVAGDIEKDFQTALESLPSQCRKIFELNRLDGLKYQEIAERLNISIKTVETQMSRALVKIRFRLKEHLSTLYLLLLLLSA